MFLLHFSTLLLKTLENGIHLFTGMIKPVANKRKKRKENLTN